MILTIPSSHFSDRYRRHVELAQIGSQKQAVLAKSSVLVIGCGGLGSFCVQSLARAGIGRLRIVDNDPPEVSNLQRQILFDERDVSRGLSKSEIAALKVRDINSTVTIEAITAIARPDNMLSLLEGMDLMIDGTDNFQTRYLMNEAALIRKIPWIYGGITGCMGVTMNFFPGSGSCFRCLYPVESSHSFVDPPAQGILATLPAMIGALQCTEALKILTASSEVNRGLITVDLWESRFGFTKVHQNPLCPICVYNMFEYLENQP